MVGRCRLTGEKAQKIQSNVEKKLIIEYYNGMPTISMFYGILIRMYLGRKDHNPPHIHALYQNKKAIFDIKTGDKMEGKLPQDKEKLVSAWIILHKDELLANWELAQNGELPYNIDPLK